MIVAMQVDERRMSRQSGFRLEEEQLVYAEESRNTNIQTRYKPR
jgi:hypothetical protein